MVGLTWPFQVNSEKKIYVTMYKSLQHISNVTSVSIHAFWFIWALSFIMLFFHNLSHSCDFKANTWVLRISVLCGAQGFCFVLFSLLADDVDYKSVRLQRLLQREQQSGNAGGTEL